MAYETSHLAAIRLGRIQGDLHVRRWDHAPDGATFQLTVDGEAFLPHQTLPERFDDDVMLAVAGPVHIAVQRVEGDVSLRQIEGQLTFGALAGDVYCEGVNGSVEFAKIDGDLVVLNLTGAVHAQQIHGDVVIDSASTPCIFTVIAGDLTIRAAGVVAVERIHGDLRAQQITELAVRDAIDGDATIAQADRCEIGLVHGDLTAVAIAQSFRCGRIDGDARLRDLAGTAQVGQIQGGLVGQDLAGGIAVVVEGEAFLETSLNAGMAYDVRAESIILRVRSPISAQFVAQTDSGEIRTHLPLAMERHRRNLVGVIGKGEALVTLRSQEDIILDAAGATFQEAPDETGRDRRRGFRVHIPNGPQIAIDLDIDPGTFPFGEEMATWWPFKETFGMNPNDQTSNNQTSGDQDAREQRQREMEQRIRDLGERTGRAARKAAEKARDYADRAASRARDTDWDAVSREVRTVFDRVMTEFETTWKDIVTEFQAPPTGQTTQQTNGPRAQRITIEKDEPVDATATVINDRPAADVGAAPTAATRDARRRAILDQLRSGALTTEEAEAQLQDL